MSLDLLRHVLDVCDDADCEIHKIDVGLDEETVSDTDFAFFIAGAQAMELSIRKSFYRGVDIDDPARKKMLDACRTAGHVISRRAYVMAFGCSDCGAPAGRECYADYGCLPSSRTVS